AAPPPRPARAAAKGAKAPAATRGRFPHMGLSRPERQAAAAGAFSRPPPHLPRRGWETDAVRAMACRRDAPAASWITIDGRRRKTARQGGMAANDGFDAAATQHSAARPRTDQETPPESAPSPVRYIFPFF